MIGHQTFQNFGGNSAYGTKQLKIDRVILMETGTYGMQYNRPYTSVVTAQTKNRLMEAVAQSRQITPATVACIAGQVISPSAQPESEVIIPHGWNERRFRFMMEVTSMDHMGNPASVEYIGGFTEYMDDSYGGLLDPEMKFYVNSITTTRLQQRNTPIGNTDVMNVIDSSHLLRSTPYSEAIGHPDKTYALRPEDVFNGIEVNEMRENSGDSMTYDTRSVVPMRGLLSKRSNTVVPVYLAETLNAGFQSARANPGHMSDAEVRESAKRTVQSLSCSDDPFLLSIINAHNDSRGWPAGVFTFADLKCIDPNVVNVAKRAPLSNEYRGTLHQAGQTESWRSTNGETLFAATLCSSIPGYMTGLTINKIVFLATNEDIGGNINITVVDARSLAPGMDITNQIESFIFRVKTELLLDLSKNNMISFRIQVSCDLLGDTNVSISLNSGSVIQYTGPSFCDSLTAPIITQNQNNISMLANDLDIIMSDIIDNGQSQTGNYAFGNNQFGNI